MSILQPIIERISTLPRVMQWVIYAAVAAIIFLLWSETVFATTVEWNDRSRAIEGKIERVTAPITLSGRQRETVTNFGPVSLPIGKDEGTLAMTRAVTEILDGKSTSDDEFNSSKSGAVSRTTMLGIARPGQRLEAIKGELRFTATPSVTMEVIAELESSPDLDAVTSVRMTKGESGRVNVQLTVMSWVLAKDTRGGAR